MQGGRTFFSFVLKQKNQTMKQRANSFLLIVVLLITFHSTSQKANSEVIYRKRSVVNKEQINKSSSADILNSTFSGMEKLEYSLLFNKEISFFTEIESLDSDENSNKLAGILMKRLGAGNGKYNIDLKKKNILHQRTLGGDLFLVTSSLDDIQWNLTKESKKIGNYVCFKATTTYKIETVRGTKEKPVVAWFTPNIPLPFGPAEYGGLPGLILELEVDNIVLFAERIVLNQKENKTIKKLSKGIKVSKQEFKDLEIKAFEQYKR